MGDELTVVWHGRLWGQETAEGVCVKGEPPQRQSAHTHQWSWPRIEIRRAVGGFV